MTKSAEKDTKPVGVGPIVSSAHLVSDKHGHLSEFEFGLTIANNAFQRWMVHCMTAAGYPDLNPLDILVLHTVNHRQRAKRLADISLVLNIEDAHTVNYAIKKLVRVELVAGERKGKENEFATTEKGRAACERYRTVRENCLLNSLSLLGDSDRDLGDLAAMLRALSGIYDQAARAAASL